MDSYVQARKLARLVIFMIKKSSYMGRSSNLITKSPVTLALSSSNTSDDARSSSDDRHMQIISAPLRSCTQSCPRHSLRRYNHIIL